MNEALSIEAINKANNRLHQDLVEHVHSDIPINLGLQYLKEARGVSPNEMGPQSIAQLKNEHERLQLWGSKFVAANKALRDEVEHLREELQLAYENDPHRSGKYVTKEAYDLLKRQYDELQNIYDAKKMQDNDTINQISSLKLATSQATIDRDKSMQNAATAAEQLTIMKQQLYELQRQARQKQGALEDLGTRLSEMQNRYDILAHHTLQLGEEKTSLIEALRERQSQLDFALAQLQLSGGQKNLIEMYKQKIQALEEELKNLKNARDGELKDLNNTIQNLQKELERTNKNYDKLKIINADNDQSNSNYRSKIVGIPEHVKVATKLHNDSTTNIKLNDTKNNEKLVLLDSIQPMKHSGVIIRVRWHPSTGRHTFGTRFLIIDTVAGYIGWSKKEQSNASKVIDFTNIARINYGYHSNVSIYKKRFDCGQACFTPSSGSSNEEELTSPPAGPARGLLREWPKISLVCCFCIVCKDGKSYDFFTITESQCFDWMMRFKKVLSYYDVKGLLDRYQFFAARGWTRLIEQCCIRQITSRKLLIEGLEKAETFAYATGMGKGGGKRRQRTSITQNKVKPKRSGFTSKLDSNSTFTTAKNFADKPNNWSDMKKKMKERVTINKNAADKIKQPLKLATNIAIKAQI